MKWYPGRSRLPGRYPSLGPLRQERGDPRDRLGLDGGPKEPLDEDPRGHRPAPCRHLGQLIDDEIFAPGDVLHLDAIEAPLELAHFVQIGPHLRAPVLLRHLLDDQLRVAAHHQLLDAKARCRP